MPNCGSQITLCDLPIRFDTYKGCGHGCEYCFSKRKRDDMDKDGVAHERSDSLERFIKGKRSRETNWCDWDIPIHLGGMSDPFQPIEREKKYSLETLKILHDTQYPFVVSTKNKMVAEDPYYSLIIESNCVVQFSALDSSLDGIERGASSFEERLAAASRIAPYRRVIIRCQPYFPALFQKVYGNIDKFHEAGAYGCVFEGFKAQRKTEGMIKLQNDYVYPSGILKKHFAAFKRKLHRLGMGFYCGENRLRRMGDSLCCCGVDGLGWEVNTANLNHFLYDKENFRYRDVMKKEHTCAVFKCLMQRAGLIGMEKIPFADIMDLACKDKWIISQLVEDGTL